LAIPKTQETTPGNAIRVGTGDNTEKSLFGMFRGLEETLA